MSAILAPRPICRRSDVLPLQDDQESYHTIEACIIQKRNGKEIEQQMLQVAVPIAKKFFYSSQIDNQDAGYHFFLAILTNGTQIEFDAISSFFTESPQSEIRNSYICCSLFDLMNQLIARLSDYKGALQIIESTLKELCASDQSSVKDKALFAFSVLLGRLDPYSPEQQGTYDIGIKIVDTILKQPFETNKKACETYITTKFYGQTISLFSQLVNKYSLLKPDAIEALIQFLETHKFEYLKEEGVRLRLQFHQILASSYFPDETSMKRVDQDELFEAVKEEPKLFWALFCKIAQLPTCPSQIKSIKEYERLRPIKRGLAIVLPYFLKCASFYIIKGYFVEAFRRQPIELEYLPPENMVCFPFFFNKYVKPHLPSLAKALGYEVSLEETTLDVEETLPRLYGLDLYIPGYECVVKTKATLVEFNVAEEDVIKYRGL